MVGAPATGLSVLNCNEKIFLAPRALLGLGLLLATLGGCATPAQRADAGGAEPEGVQSPAVPDSAAEPAPAAQHRRLDAREGAEVRRLLAQAESAIAEDHLTYPASGSALALYDRVRILDPGNAEARRGLERIVERYLELATSAAAAGHFESAHAMLDRSRLVDPDHPGIGPVEAQTALLTGADRRVIDLNAEALRDRHPEVVEILRRAGAASRGGGCRAEITARNDAEGRWIYQRMSDARGDSRIRAQLDIGTPPRVEVICFSDPS